MKVSQNKLPYRIPKTMSFTPHNLLITNNYNRSWVMITERSEAGDNIFLGPMAPKNNGAKGPI